MNNVPHSKNNDYKIDTKLLISTVVGKRFLLLPFTDTITDAVTLELYKSLPMFIHLFQSQFWEWDKVFSHTGIIFCYHYQKKIT